MNITFITHSCFAVDTDGALIVFDYAKDTADGRLQRIIDRRGCRQLYFVCSHFHEDHYNAEILEQPWARLLLSYDTVKRRRVPRKLPAAILHPGEVYVDENLILNAIHSTDVGISSLVTLPDGTTLYHAGDNNNWYFSAEEDQDNIRCSLLEMEGIFLSTLREVRALTEHVDYVFFPIDPRLGPETLRGAFQWLWHIDTRVLFPMHCWERWDEVKAAVAELKSQFPELKIVMGEEMMEGRVAIK